MLIISLPVRMGLMWWIQTNECLRSQSGHPSKRAGILYAEQNLELFNLPTVEMFLGPQARINGARND